MFNRSATSQSDTQMFVYKKAPEGNFRCSSMITSTLAPKEKSIEVRHQAVKVWAFVIYVQYWQSRILGMNSMCPSLQLLMNDLNVKPQIRHIMRELNICTYMYYCHKVPEPYSLVGTQGGQGPTQSHTHTSDTLCILTCEDVDGLIKCINYRQ